MGFICLYVLIQKSGQKTAKSHLCEVVPNSNVCFIKGLHMHQIFILKLFEHHRHIQSVQDFVFIVIYFVVSLLWVIEFGRIFELYKIHWINQNWQTILQDRSKIYIGMFCQVFWVVKILFESKLWYAYSHFCNLKQQKLNCFSFQNTEVKFGVPKHRYVLLIA